jgi:hypothetical protein
MGILNFMSLLFRAPLGTEGTGGGSDSKAAVPRLYIWAGDYQYSIGHFHLRELSVTCLKQRAVFLFLYQALLKTGSEILI